MKKYLKDPVVGYIGELSSRNIVPGGGSAAAVEAALGAALNLMVMNFSLKKSTPKDTAAAISAAKRLQEKSLSALVKLADLDSEAFSGLMKALSAGKSARKAYIKAATVPLEVCKECLVSMEVTAMLLEKGNKNLFTDVGCAAHMLSSAFRSARLNVLVNLKYMGGDFAVKVSKELSAMTAYVTKTESQISRVVEKALEPEA